MLSKGNKNKLNKLITIPLSPRLPHSHINLAYYNIDISKEKTRNEMIRCPHYFKTKTKYIKKKNKIA